ncbi:LptF/LptG family permease [Campylobacter sputorum]|uniref:LptF/LptG family permease n=1 Tax=Campylobacter sputorum TaxID=206 RepID=UPI00053BEE70|nr:LptF/LptG family permease [Campylobacter sputorum]
MNRVNRYLLTNFLSSFASLFATLFIIVSIVFFIQISRITSYVSITFFELARLYMFLLPQILLFTIPISFFVSLAISFFKLSKENESIVIFTLGYPTRQIGKFFAILSTFVSILLLGTSLIMIPIAEELSDNFIGHKLNDAQLNIKASQFGQKFSDWMVYIENQSMDQNTTVYENLILYNPKNSDSNDRVLMAKIGYINNFNGTIELKLIDGYSYDIASNVINATKFDNMIIRSKQKDNSKEIVSIVDYWKQALNDDKRKKDFTINVLVSIFPLASVYFALTFGIVTYRYEKGFIYFGIFGVLFCYFAALMILVKQPFIAIPLIFIVTLLASIFSFKIKILSRY